MYKVKAILFTIILVISCKNVPSSENLKVSKRQLMVNGSPYIIKGVCYHPVPKGSDKRDFSNLTMDLSLMKEAGMNTIRVYEPIDDVAVLDEIYDAGFKVIVGFGYSQNGVYDISSNTYLDYVTKYKDHNAILMWELGNEYNYHPEWFEDDLKNWYSVLNAAAYKIKEVDSNHPITTAHGELPNQLALKMSTNIDVWGMNVYRWDNPEAIFREWEKISTKPMYLSEAGGDSYMTISKDGYDKGINEKAQADANAKILDVIFNNNNICSGVTLFSFTDGWWKAGDNNKQTPGGWAPNSSGVPYDGTPNEEYWGIVDINRNKKEAFDIIKKKYNSIVK